MPVLVDDKAKSLLRDVPYFRALDDNALVAVGREVVERHFKAGEIIFLEGESVAGLHLVVAGMGKVYRLSEGGREHVLTTLRPGDSCNEVPVVDGGPNPANFAVLENSTVWVISEASLTRLRRQYPALNEMIIKNLAMRCRQLVQRVYNLSFLSVTGRLAAFLLQQSEQEGESLRRQWTQDEIAAHLGTVREMVGRAFRELQKAELIAIDRHRIEILDREGLKELIWSEAEHITHQDTSRPIALSKTVLRSVLKTEEYFYSSNAQQDQRLAGQESVIALDLRPVAVVPLIECHDKDVGVLYAAVLGDQESMLTESYFLPLLQSAANQAVLSLEMARRHAEDLSIHLLLQCQLRLCSRMV